MWRVIVPVKRWEVAKSRLELPASARARVAEAMATDTVSAICACTAVDRVVVVASSGSLVGSAALAPADDVLVQPPTASLAEAVTWAAGRLPSTPGRVGTAVVVADLPALRPTELAEALAVAATADSSMVTDRHGSGTTTLAVTGSAPLIAHFGAHSAAHHGGAGALRIDLQLTDALAGLRCDVDTITDLAVARALGLGAHTRALDRQLGSPP